jgi:hypothetical protein
LNAEDIRERLKGTNPETVATQEAQGAQEKAREQNLDRWYDERFGARKPMKGFEGTLVDIHAEVRKGFYERGERAGQEWSQDVAVCVWEDVNCLDGDPASTTEFRLPDAGKNFSRHSEAAITVRYAQEQNPDAEIKDYFDLVGKRLRMDGDWEPTFLGEPNARGQRFWNGTYFYRPTILESVSASAAEPSPENVKKLAEWCAGKEPSEVTNAALARAAIGAKVQSDSALMSLIGDGADKFLAYAAQFGLVVGEDGKLAVV